MRRTLIAAALVALAACGQPATENAQNAPMDAAPAPAAAAPGCTASAETMWEGLKITGTATGATCAAAQVSLAILGADGKALHSFSATAANLRVVFGEAADAPPTEAASMQKALAEWIDPASSTFMIATDKLPEWKSGEEAPMAGEFIYIPVDGMDRKAYEAMRKAKRPLFCYVQGAESMACVQKLENGQVVQAGVQTFPG